MLLVTGITGHSGRYFLRELVANGLEDSLKCVVRETSDISLLDASGLSIEMIVGDLGDQSLMDKAMVGVDTVVHIGSIFYSTTVMKAAAKSNVKRVILVHTTGIYSKYKSASGEYRNIERTIGRIVERSDTKIGTIYLRPTMIYGYPNDRNMIKFIKMVDKLRFLPVIDHGKSLIQPVNGRDLGRAYYQVLDKSNIMDGDYILSGEKPVTMLEMFKLISENLGRKTTFISVPLGLGMFMARCLKITTLGRIDYVERVERMAEDRSFSHEVASADFNYAPMPFAEGLRIEIEQYLENLGRSARGDGGSPRGSVSNS